MIGLRDLCVVSFVAKIEESIKIQRFTRGSSGSKSYTHQAWLDRPSVLQVPAPVVVTAHELELGLNILE